MPAVASKTVAESRTLRLTTCSTAMPNMTSPASGPQGTRIRVGFSPTSPHAAAGMRIEPPPSLACAIGTMPEATAAAEPPEEPPVVRSGFQGLWDGPNRSGSVLELNPNSGVFVLPQIIRPARLKRTTSSVSESAMWSLRIRLPSQWGAAAQCAPMSFNTNGTPPRGPLAG